MSSANFLALADGVRPALSIGAGDGGGGVDAFRVVKMRSLRFGLLRTRAAIQVRQLRPRSAGQCIGRSLCGNPPALPKPGRGGKGAPLSAYFGSLEQWRRQQGRDWQQFDQDEDRWA